MAKLRTKKAVDQEGNMTLGGHMRELRNRLIVCALVLFGGCAYFLTISDRLVNLLADLGLRYGYTFVYLSPQEKLIQYFRLSVVAAIIITIPVALYQLWAFAKPGLKKSESFFFGLVMLFGLLLFCVGVAFAYFVVLPFMLNFLITLGGTDYITASISIAEYLNFVILIFLIFGCVFEMPLLTVILAKMGIASPSMMRKGRGIAIVLIFFIAAVITPPDIVSQILVAVPMIVLYQISIFLAGVFYKPRFTGDDEDDEEEEADD